MHSRNWQMQKLNLEICMYFAIAKAPTPCYTAHTSIIALAALMLSS